MKILSLTNPWRFLLISVLVIGIFFRFANLDKKVFWFDETATIFKISGYLSSRRRPTATPMG
ncbi:MAG: hypothetical protein QNJ55_31860 [Xenococcus sp. MO_188.B8]|nr:hypothetical protein [Xenococcus sp. MO_188.B8]